MTTLGKLVSDAEVLAWAHAYILELEAENRRLRGALQRAHGQEAKV